VHRGQSWVIAAAVILEATSLWTSAIDDKDQASARLCHAAGVKALWSIAAQHSAKSVASLTALPDPFFDRVAFATACDRLQSSGRPVCKDRDAAWERFAALRGEYEILILRLSQILLVPLARNRLPSQS